MPVLHKPAQLGQQAAIVGWSNHKMYSSNSSKAMKMHFNLTLTKNISKLNELNYYLQVDQELDPYFCS